MQKYVEITEDTPIEDSRELLLNNDKTIASHYSGTAFPTENLVVGMECYRTDQKIKYRLTSLSPATWEATLTADAVAKIKVNNATHADTAGNADTTDGKHATDAAGQIALKDGSNDLNCRLLRATYANQNTISGAIAFRINNTSDNYTRYCSDAAAIRTFLGLGNVNNTADANKSVNQAKLLRPDNLAGANAADLIYVRMADNDYFRIRVGGTGSNAGYAEIATADDGSEPIHVRQYTGAFTTLTRTATLLDGSGNTNFPGTVSAANITATNGRIEATGTSSNLPQVLLHIPNVNYSRLRMSADGVIHAQNGGNDNYVNMKAANFIGNLSGKATTAGTADVANWLNPNTTLRYGASGLQYFNHSVNANSAPNANGNPQNGWHHILRMNHANNAGYYADIAVPLNDSSGIWWRRVTGGVNNGWYRVCDSNNASAFTVGNANKLIGKNWYWSGQGGQPAWLWGGSDGTNMYVYNPSNFRVANANTVADLLVHGGRNKEANKIVRTNASGYLDIGYLNSDIGVENGNVTNVIYDNGDGYFRKCSFAHFTSKINVIGGTTAQKLLQEYTVPSDCAQVTLSGFNLNNGPVKVIWESARLNYAGDGYWEMCMMPKELGITGVTNKGRYYAGTHSGGAGANYGACILLQNTNTGVSGNTFPIISCYSYCEAEIRYFMGKYVLIKSEAMDWKWGSSSNYWISKSTVNTVSGVTIYCTSVAAYGEGSSVNLKTGIKSGTRIKIYQ